MRASGCPVIAAGRDVGNLQVTDLVPASWRGFLASGAGGGLVAGSRVHRLLDYAWLDGTDPGGVDYEGIPPGGRVYRTHPDPPRMDQNLI